MREIKMYPKTPRYTARGEYVITEKMDGSNVTFYKWQGVLFVCKRNSVAPLEEALTTKSFCLKGMHEWLGQHGAALCEAMVEGSAIVGEWMGEGRLKYPDTQENRFRMFAKANVELSKNGAEVVGLKNILYKEMLFVYPFIEQKIPEYITTVPIVYQSKDKPNLDDLDELYISYKETIERDCEGFIIIEPGGTIQKYVRKKNGVETEHTSKEE